VQFKALAYQKFVIGFQILHYSHSNPSTQFTPSVNSGQVLSKVERAQDELVSDFLLVLLALKICICQVKNRRKTKAMLTAQNLPRRINFLLKNHAFLQNFARKSEQLNVQSPAMRNWLRRHTKYKVVINPPNANNIRLLFS